MQSGLARAGDAADVEIFHNLLWPRYKGKIFSELNELAKHIGFRFLITHVAATDGERASLGTLDLSCHRYPFKVIFDSPYDQVPKWSLVAKLFVAVWKSPAKLVILPGYSALEHWSMLLAALLTRRRIGVFCDSTARDRTQTRAKSVLKRFFFTRCVEVFAYGVRSAAYVQMHGVRENQISYPCQAAALAATYERRAIQSERVLKASPTPRILYVGRLAPEKDLETLLKAFQLYSSQATGAKLILVGTGPQLRHLEMLADALGCAASVSFLGALSAEELAGEYLRATVLVLASKSEPWGLVVNEALHYGCPVVVSDACGCVPELVDDGITGIAFEQGDAQHLASTLMRAEEAFGDVPATASNCLKLIDQYTPERAAERMLDGCVRALNRGRAK